MEKQEYLERIEKSLDKVRPYLQADGGDIKLIELDDEMVVHVELTGACVGCPFSMQTLQMGVEETIKKDIPEIQKVVAVNA